MQTVENVSDRPAILSTNIAIDICLGRFLALFVVIQNKVMATLTTGNFIPSNERILFGHVRLEIVEFPVMPLFLPNFIGP